MKKSLSIVLTLVAALGMVFATIAPAGAVVTHETLTWKNVDTQPNGLCGYSSGTVDAQEPAPGNDYSVSSGINYYRDTDPCTPGAVNVARNAGDLKVQVALNCSYTDDTTGVRSGEFNVWTGNVKSNAQGTGSVSGSLSWAAYKSTYGASCGYDELAGDPDDGVTPWLRTIVKSWYWTAFGYVEYDHTTHWIDPCKFH